MKKIILILILFISVHMNTNAQGTVLAPGDIAIVYAQADTPDEFAFINFVDLVAGTTIYFTDCGTTAAGFFLSPCNEGAKKFVAATAIPAGTIISYPSAQLSTHTDSRITGSLALGTTGDQVIVFQDADGAGGTDPGNNPSFIFALNLASTQFAGDPSNSNTETNLPSGLSVPSSALGVGSGAGVSDENDNSAFNSSLFPFATVAAAKAAILNAANWAGSSSITATPYATYVANMPLGFGAALPVELISFQGKPQSKANELTWSTASETVFSHYEIERSLDGRAFSKIGMVLGNGDTADLSEYGFLDYELNANSYYYRLRMVDLDQSFEYSPIIRIQSTSKYSASVYPNPSTDLINIQFDGLDAGNVNYSITTSDGKLIKEGMISNENSRIDISQLPNGLYLIQMNGASVNESIKFMKK